MATMTHDSTRTAGLGFALASAASFGLSGSLARGLMDAGWSSAAAVSVRILLAAVVLAPLAVVQLRGRWDILRRNLPLAATTADVHFGDVSMAWWLPVLGLGVVTAALAYVTGIAATRRLGSRLASFVALTEVLAALGFAWVLLGQAPRSIQLLGCAL